MLQICVCGGGGRPASDICVRVIESGGGGGVSLVIVASWPVMGGIESRGEVGSV